MKGILRSGDIGGAGFFRIINDVCWDCVFDSLERYKNCDWGDLDEEDKMMNGEALKCGDRLLAAYKNAEKDWKIWIITEADRKTTTILFPEEY